MCGYDVAVTILSPWGLNENESAGVLSRLLSDSLHILRISSAYVAIFDQPLWFLECYCYSHRIMFLWKPSFGFNNKRWVLCSVHIFLFLFVRSSRSQRCVCVYIHTHTHTHTHTHIHTHTHTHTHTYNIKQVINIIHLFSSIWLSSYYHFIIIINTINIISNINVIFVSVCVCNNNITITNIIMIILITFCVCVCV